MEDIRIGREGKSTQYHVNVDVASSPFIEANKQRTCLIISRPVTNYFTISFYDAAVLDQGINIYPGGNPFILNIQQHGSLVTRRMTVIGTVGLQTIGVWEEKVEQE